MTKKLYTVTEVSSRYYIARRTTERYVANGDLAFMRLPGGRLRFREEDLEEFERRCLRPAVVNELPRLRRPRVVRAMAQSLATA